MIRGWRGRHVGGRGFSLLEVLLAMALIALLSGAIFGFLWNVMDRRDALVHATADAQGAGALFELLEGDLSCVVAGDAVQGAGIAGDGVQLRLMSRRVWAPTVRSERDAAMGDLQVSEYMFDASRGVLSVRRRPAGQNSDHLALPAARAEPVAERLEAMRFRYFDGRSWVRAFDSLENESLPVAVEIAIWQRRAGGGEPVSAVEEDFDGQPGDVRVPERAPDRLRIISVPDGPTTWWKEAP